MPEQGNEKGTSPAVSVIIPAYKTTAYIAKALDSVLAQSYRDFEIIVINDGCPDTLELEKVLQAYMKDIVYIKQPNGGLAHARNTGIRRSRGRFIALLDSDDFWEPDYLATQIRILEEDPAVGAVYANALIFGRGDHPGKFYMDVFPSSGDVSFLSLVTGQCNIIGAAVTFRREAIELAGLYDPEIRHAEDFDLWLRFVKLGGRIVYHRRVLYHVRSRPESLTRQSVQMRASFLRILEKNEKAFPLTQEERAAVDKVKRDTTAFLQYERGKEAFFQGDVAGAIRDIRAANEYWRMWKLRLILLLMKTMPGILRRLLRNRAPR